MVPQIAGDSRFPSGSDFAIFPAMPDRPMHTVPGLFDRLTALYADGVRALEDGRLHDAIAAFSQGLQLDDHFSQGDVTMYAQRAFAYQRLGDNIAAIRDYNRAIELEPHNQARHLFHRGMCFAALGGHEEHAVNDFGRAIAIYPDEPGPYHLRGKLYATDLGRYHEAIADFDRLLATHPIAEGYQLRGYAKLNLGMGRDAIPDLLAANRLEQDTYTDYLLAWAGAVAPDDELFYRSMQAVLAAEPDTYRQYFLDNDDFARFRHQPRFRQIIGA
jgi:tetratricopeptide (TPR) repeat protein